MCYENYVLQEIYTCIKIVIQGEYMIRLTTPAWFVHARLNDVIATKKGWVKQGTNEILVSVTCLDDKIKDYRNQLQELVELCDKHLKTMNDIDLKSQNNAIVQHMNDSESNDKNDDITTDTIQTETHEIMNDCNVTKNESMFNENLVCPHCGAKPGKRIEIFMKRHFENCKKQENVTE